MEEISRQYSIQPVTYHCSLLLFMSDVRESITTWTICSLVGNEHELIAHKKDSEAAAIVIIIDIIPIKEKPRAILCTRAMGKMTWGQAPTYESFQLIKTQIRLRENEKATTEGPAAKLATEGRFLKVSLEAMQRSLQL